ncbi:MAG TPA: glucose-1-phosphate thymidylyltransferase [Methanothrix sp.]|uniref:glucose-1-phosphate thymidylyltransferase n=1 Tax=Methanothrix sp. TaxID=90426 RepID=UPI002D0632EC|nr:glucose-1-phosphate thymidylyltransferase [Methanothrix sp.]MDI9417687.1 glucose-1-phosphate thymidylyltransferase [Euryarchaeota archaeon]HON36685.1 glucose-1-phosphate thymidylyltransferase [Methanothrix sp.]HRU75916.1 glucose-1-phosphate thymidylyltransferase [Methanothrix sp.]
MKALILSGGSGTRLRPLTYSQQKQLIPVANRPVLFYAIEDVIEAGAEEIGIILGPNKEQVMETVRSVDWPVPIRFIYQGEPKGLAHTILVAEDFLDEDFVMYLGDNILRDGIVNHEKRFRATNSSASVLLTPVDDPQRFGVADLNPDGSIRRLVEKPKEPPSNFALVGVYFFTPTIIQACKSITPSWRNELEITDAIQWLIEHGYKVDASFVEGWWKDTGKPEDIFDANRLILDDIDGRCEGEVEESRILGRVVMEKGARIIRSVVKGPCIIGERSTISDSYIGPYTSIGIGCRISGTEIEDSIVMDESSILNAGKVVESLIGRNVRIRECDSLPRGSRLIVGDNSDISL